MEKKRWIFDLDYTLMVGDRNAEVNYFRDVFRSDGDAFLENMIDYLHEYEKTYSRYDVELLSKFMTKKSRLDFNEDIVNGWIEAYGNCENKIEDGVVEALEFLKSKGVSIAVLTNWFRKSQEMRLRNSGLLEYVDDIYAGDTILKPRREAYIMSIDRFNPDESVFVGDHLEKDYIGPRCLEVDSILYDKDDRHNKNIVKIKNMREIKRCF